MKRDCMPVAIATLFIAMAVSTWRQNKAYADTGVEGATRIENGVVFNSSQTIVFSCSGKNAVQIYTGSPNTACLKIKNISPNYQITIASYTVLASTAGFTLLESTWGVQAMLDFQQFTGNLFACSNANSYGTQANTSSATINIGFCGTQQPTFGKP